MEKIIEKAPHIPLTGKVFVDGDLLLDYIDRLRTALPEEVRQAQWIKQEKERLLEEARLKAQSLIEEAEKRTEMMAQENELVRKARKQADEIIIRTRKLAGEIKTGALSYADTTLAQLENNINQILAKIRENRQELKSYPMTRETVKGVASDSETSSASN